jgi:3-phosphoshikimate 1-carboxyvinyltransferase
MTVELHKQSPRCIGRYELPLSKSEVNRWLVLQYLFPETLRLTELSTAQDSQYLAQALTTFDDATDIDCGAAGTVYRFLTALAAVRPGTRVLRGTARLMERPISPLVNALRDLGADIEYVGENDCGPLKIRGKALSGGEVFLDNTTSSQFVTALMLIAPTFPEGLKIRHRGLGTSASYIYMTALILEKMGVKVKVNAEAIVVNHFSGRKGPSEITAEADWSAASYAYGMALLADEVEMYLPGLRLPSFQGDSRLVEYFAHFGIESIYTGGGVRIRKTKASVVLKHPVEWDFSDTPDLAQACIVALAAFGQAFQIKGLHTLPTKETDRLKALQTELVKFGLHLEIDNRSCRFDAKSSLQPHGLPLSTYEDHRMAMALSILSMKTPIRIKDAEVVGKSFPGFWKSFFRLSDV